MCASRRKLQNETPAPEDPSLGAAFRFFRSCVGLYRDAVVLPLQTYLPTRLRQPWARLRTYLPTSEFLRRGNTSAHSLCARTVRPDLRIPQESRCATAYSTWLGKPRLLCPCSTQWLACHRTLSVQLPRSPRRPHVRRKDADGTAQHERPASRSRCPRRSSTSSSRPQMVQSQTYLPTYLPPAGREPTDLPTYF